MRLALTVLFVIAGVPVLADPVVIRNGTDSFVAGSSGLPAVDAPGDVFASGASIVLRGRAAGNVHAVGFSLEVDLPVAQNLYAAGGSVVLRAPVASNLTAAGFSLRTETGAEVGGNARLAGGSVEVNGPVKGALTASGGAITLNSVIGGDVMLQTEQLLFGPGARIGGQLIYSAPAAMDVPASVIAPERVTFRLAEENDAIGRWHDTRRWRDYPMMPTFLTLFSGWLVTLAFLEVVAAAMLLMAPDLTERLRQSAAMRPGAAVLGGFLGLATLIGLVPVAALTVIGLPLVPFALLLILVFWTAGYLLGAFTIALGLRPTLGLAEQGIGGRLLLLAAVLAVLSALNFIPVAGWVVNIAVMLLGLGAILRPLFARFGATLPPAPPMVSP